MIVGLDEFWYIYFWVLKIKYISSKKSIIFNFYKQHFKFYKLNKVLKYYIIYLHNSQSEFNLHRKSCCTEIGDFNPVLVKQRIWYIGRVFLTIGYVKRYIINYYRITILVYFSAWPKYSLFNQNPWPQTVKYGFTNMITFIYIIYTHLILV